MEDFKKTLAVYLAMMFVIVFVLIVMQIVFKLTDKSDCHCSVDDFPNHSEISKETLKTN